MKKTILYFLLLSLFFCATIFTGVAIDFSDEETLKNDIQDELLSIIDDDVIDVLEELGFDNLDFDSIYNFSLDNITEFFSVTLKSKIKCCFKIFFEILSAVILTSVVTIILKDVVQDDMITILSVIIITLLCVNTVSASLSAVISVLSLSGKFMMSYVPIYTLIISLSGNTASALTYNTFVLGFAEFISTVITTCATDFMGVFFCLSITFSLNSNINTGRFFSAVNKFVSIVLGLSASMFTGFLSLKSIMSASVDSISIKSIRFLISSLIPVVGSSISEAYSTLLGSINLIKSSVAFVGILVIIIINIPVILETLAYYISFSILGYLADTVSATKTGDILRGFSCGIRILLLLTVFEMFILIVSTGILLSVKNGG